MRETTRIFGPEKHLVGTFTEATSSRGPCPNLMVLLTNAGVVSRSGPHRINVHLARRFAAMGLQSLRWDMSGIGDSGRPSNDLPMRDQFVADTRAAMDEAQRAYGVSHFVMIGFCSGAEVAYGTAMQDERVVGAVLFDLFTYPTWKTQWLRVKHRIRRYGLWSAARRLAFAILARLMGRRSLASTNEGELPPITPSREEFAARLNELHARGTRVLLLYSGELELHNYERQFHDRFSRSGIVDKVDYAYLRECDHVFTTAEGQRVLVSITAEWVHKLQAAVAASNAAGRPY
jgi:hypothetical protein